ncbi:MAG: DUF5777 family beta-barrel protein [Flavobacteriaceae bacterium]
MKKSLYFLCIIIFNLHCYSQDDLLKDLDEDVVVDTKINNTFEALKIINIESTELAGEKEFYFLIAHRFGSLKNGFDDLFGLDVATIKFSFFYGVKDWLQLGVARSEFKKMYDINAKYRFMTQETDGFPFTISGFSSIGINTVLKKRNFPKMTFNHRLTYLSELLISRKMNDNLSLQIAPIFIHENLVANPNQSNSQFALSLAGSYKISDSWSITTEYTPHLNRATNSNFADALSFGLDWQVGGHVFQLMFTNSQPLNDSHYVTNATGVWEKGDVYFGFNLYRVF